MGAIRFLLAVSVAIYHGAPHQERKTKESDFFFWSNNNTSLIIQFSEQAD